MLEAARSTSRCWMTSSSGVLCTSTSNIVRSSSSGSIPWLIVRLDWGSRSTHSTRLPRSTRATPRLSVVVVFATPPFWFASAITCPTATPPTIERSGRVCSSSASAAEPVPNCIATQFVPPKSIPAAPGDRSRSGSGGGAGGGDPLGGHRVRCRHGVPHVRRLELHQVLIDQALERLRVALPLARDRHGIGVCRALEPPRVGRAERCQERGREREPEQERRQRGEVAGAVGRQLTDAPP